jgi:hypothetical protein
MAGTAIIAAYTRDGFIIASDGLQHRGEKAIVNQTAQKIYSLTREGCHLAYAFAGTTKFVQEGRTRLDLYKIVAMPLRRNSLLESTQDAATFVRELVRMLNRQLQSLGLREYQGAARLLNHVFDQDEIAGKSLPYEAWTNSHSQLIFSRAYGDLIDVLDRLGSASR